MAKAPAFMFYPGDWLRDPQLMRAPLEAQGIWIKALCFMWFEEVRGELKGTHAELARLLGLDMDTWKRFCVTVIRHDFAEFVTEGDDDVDGKVTLRNRRMLREQSKQNQHVSRQQRYRDRQRDGKVTVEVTPKLPHSPDPIPSPDPEIDLCSDTLSMNGTSAAGAAPSSLPLKLQSQESESDKITPEDLVAGWNEICVPAGLSKVISLDAIRRKKALERIRESYKHARAYGESVEDFWGHVFTKVSKSAWCRGQRPSPGHENWRADFDFVIHDSTRPLKAREGKYV